MRQLYFQWGKTSQTNPKNDEVNEKMVGSSEVERRILEIRQDSEQKKKDFQASLMRMKAENRRLEAALVRQRVTKKKWMSETRYFSH
mmetsp:Transcript_5841/g.8639  ORF Transcript_5841/g.8639 Transcript_5841/m.8639 type:complete len:87 (+) Transcript_5841:821-1081(+)